MRRLHAALGLCLLAFRVTAQLTPVTEEIQQDVIEGLFEDYETGDGGDIQPEWLLLLEDLRHRPLNINQADADDLRVFFFLDGNQIQAILAHRATYGEYLHPLELQVVEGLDIRTVQRLLPFLRAARAGDNRLHRSHYWQTGRREFTLRWERSLEVRKGYLPATDGAPPPYEGDPNRLVGRLRYFSGNQISYGLSFEKDAGEALFRGSNPRGFDFYSAHIQIRRPFRGCQQLLVGDYGLSMGQGLLVSTGFVAGKTAAVTLIKRTQRNLFPMNSWQESRFFRGAAAEWQLAPRWYLLTFASLRQRDANAVLSDSTFSEVSLHVSSFQQSGFHRTASEIADEGILREAAAGAGIAYRSRRVRVGLQGVGFRYNPGYVPSERPYNAKAFRGEDLAAVSVDYQVAVQGHQIFGEAAISHNGGYAVTSGLLGSPHPKVQIALLARHFSPDYWNVWGAPLAESTLPRNETGMYGGLVLHPLFGLRLSGFVDLWQHPWLTFQSDSPVRGREHLIRLDYAQRRKWNAYLQYRWKGREINRTGSVEIPDQIPVYRQQWRMQIQYELYRILTLRTRLEWSRADQGGGREDGFLVAQDLLYHPMGSRWSATARLAIFHTGGYASRIYMFENDLLYTFGLRPYYHQGHRGYINIRYRPWSALTLEARYEVYRLYDQETIGTGSEEINGPVRSGFKAQVRWMF